MTDDDKRNFYALLKDVHSFYRVDLTKFAASIWWNALQRFDFEAINKAFSNHAADPQRGQFAPKPADLVRELQGTQTDRAALAWSKTLQAIERVGAHQSVAFDDPAIHTAVEDLGGWPAICATTYDELPHLERRFCTAYKAHQKAGTPHTPHLLGHAEIANRTAGKRIAPPVLIGDAEAAQQVRLTGSNSAARIGAQPIAALLAGVTKSNASNEETQP